MYTRCLQFLKISQKELKTAGLPCALVELRQKKKLYYASEAYFGFILFLESIYLKNLTLRMMMAHSDGDLVKAIHDYVILSDEVRSKFSDLFENDSEVEVEDRMTILKYIAERYVHMRGCWFVKFMKNNRNKSLGETKALAAPTRAKVAHKHVE